MNISTDTLSGACLNGFAVHHFAELFSIHRATVRTTPDPDQGGKRL
jgi:hypothetical protein